MRYVCIECGCEFDTPDRWEEDYGEFWGMPCHQTMTGCPRCGGDYDEIIEGEEI